MKSVTQSLFDLTIQWKVFRLIMVLLFFIVLFTKTIKDYNKIIFVCHIYVLCRLQFKVSKAGHLTHHGKLFGSKSKIFLLRRRNRIIRIFANSIRMAIDELKTATDVSSTKLRGFITNTNILNGKTCNDDWFGTLFSSDTHVNEFISFPNLISIIVFPARFDFSRLASFRPVSNLVTGNAFSFLRLSAAGFRYIHPGACKCDRCGRRHNLGDFVSDPSDARYHSHPCTISIGHEDDYPNDDYRQEQRTNYAAINLSESMMSFTNSPRQQTPLAPPFRFVWDDAHAAVTSTIEPRVATRRHEDSEPCCFICYNCNLKWRGNPVCLLKGCFNCQCQRYRQNSDRQPDHGLSNILLRERELILNRLLCMKCKLRKRCVVFLPCSHLCTCGKCSKEVKRCPICHQIIFHRIQCMLI